MKKKNFIIASLISLSAMAVGAIGFATAANFNVNSFNGVKAADNWTEKAYVAPTGESVGYKHYYLGCPGNYRTSDAEHLNDVSLEDITIPKLNVIDRSAIDANDGILNVNENKIKYLDQTTVLGQEAGTAVFVNDAGHKSVFFSRSNELHDNHYSEFRFENTKNNLTSITFDYRYLDYNESHIEEGEGTTGYHYYFEFKVDEYQKSFYNLINDDEWHTATIPVREDVRNNVTAFLFNIYEFQGHCYISNFHFNGFDDLELEPASTLDAVDPVTISNLGLTSGSTIPTGGNHLFATYDFSSKKAIDLWIEYEYEKNSSDSYVLIYLFNQQDEAGPVLRLQTNRSEDDGIVPAYIFTMNAYGGESTIVQTAGSAGTYFYFPRACGVKSTTENVIHITAECIDETKNIYEITYMIGVKGGTLYYPSTNAEALDNQKVTFNIELGADYFDSGNHQKVRFSAVSNANCVVSDYLPTSNEVVYKDYLGNIIGKKNENTLELPNYAVENKALVGWFDQNGDQLEKGQTVSQKIIARPVFVDTQDKMFTLTDVGFASPIALTSSSPAAQCSGNYSINTGNRIDFYFIYEFEERTAADNYFVFVMNYDYIDEKTRVCIRIDNSASSKKVRGYFYGASLGAAGAAGTRFESSNDVRENETTPLLIHVALIDNGNNSASVSADFTNLANDTSYSLSRDVVFDVDWNLSSTYDVRNKFGYTAPVNCSFTIRNAF